MALDRPTMVTAVKNRIYNSGMGEKPSIRIGTGTATVSGDVAVFSVQAGDGLNIRKGQVLSSWGSTDASDAYGFYVTDVNTDVITTLNGYDGIAIPHNDAVPTALEHQARVTEHTIQSSIDNIIAGYLYPELFDIIMDSFTPNLASLQTVADALDEDIIRAWQTVGPTEYQVPIKLIQNMPTAKFASGKMVTYDVRIGTDVDYSAKRRIAISTSTSTALEFLIAKGAAALCIEGVEQAVDDETPSESRPLWASFYNAKRQLETDMAKEAVVSFKVDRG